MTAKILPSSLALALLIGSGAARADKTIKVPDSDTTVTVGGYVKLDAIWSDVSAGVDSVGDQELNTSLIPVGPTAGQHKKDQVTLHARQTRLFFGTSTPTSYGPVTTYIEGDFFGADGNESVTNSNNFRIRHAYGTFGHLLAGQFWTNFFNEQAYAETLDFGGPAGEIFIRQAQLRWTQKFARGEWSVSAESPESLFAIPGSATPFRSDSDHFPDLTGRAKFALGRGTYSVGLLGRNIHLDSPSAPAASGGKWGGAATFNGIVPMFGRDDLRFDVNAGNAIGRYQVSGFLPDGYLDSTGRVRLARQESAFIAYRHYWTPTLRSTLELSATNSRPPAGTSIGINQSDHSQHLNLIWSPVASVNLGGELLHADRSVTGGARGDLNRVQFSAQYNF
ncbi:MAG TPA: DcaP family trimeric outer membrane transporter [Burkholderiales bacterium]|nr:DcaP family trimeric outer membrane transporter [Burkholderiales bacterium]